MRPVRRLLAPLLTTALAGVLTAPPATAATEPAPDPDPVRAIVLPPLDAVVGLLGPLPLPHAPYDGDVCPTGADTCVDDVIDRMRARLDRLAASCHHSAVFSLAYLRVTENVRDAARTGHFADPRWLNRVDAVFAELYFDVTGAWDAGRRDDVPAAWRIALRAEDEQAMSGLGNFLLAMNAHINRDFPYVLETVGLTSADGTSHKRDHDAYNTRLDSLYGPVFVEEAARFDPTFDDIDLGTLEETAAGVIMRGWREVVWRHAELLAAAPSQTARRAVSREIEGYAALQARLIRSAFSIGPQARSARDTWCAEHGVDRG